MQCKPRILSHEKSIDFKSFVVWVKRMSHSVFEPSSVQTRQFQTLPSLTVMPAQRMNPTNQNQLLNLTFKK